MYDFLLSRKRAKLCSYSGLALEGRVRRQLPQGSVLSCRRLEEGGNGGHKSPYGPGTPLRKWNRSSAQYSKAVRRAMPLWAGPWCWWQMLEVVVELPLGCSHFQ